MTCNAASAAVGSPGLVTEQPLPSGTIGERMFVLNPTSEQALDPSVLGWALEQVEAAGGKAAWLCSSNSEADTLQAILGVVGHPRVPPPGRR